MHVLKMKSTIKQSYISGLLQRLLINHFLINHKKDFEHKQQSENIELSKNIWSVKDTKVTNNVKWWIVESSIKLNLKEYFDDITLLNKRSEFINHCLHQNKLLLNSLKRNVSINWH